MLAIQHKGPGPLTFLVLCLCAAPAAMAQIAPPALMATQVMGDTGEFSGFARPAAQPAGNGPLDEAPFTVLRQGGPWSVADTPVVPTGTRAGHPRVVRQLLKAHADPMAWNRDGRHALSEAALGGQVAVMDMLVASGLDAGTPDRHGLNALHAAALGRQPVAASWLRQHGVQVTHPLTQVLIDKPEDAPVAMP